MSTVSLSKKQVPVIDISKDFSTTEIVKDLHFAFSTFGCCHLIDSSVPSIQENINMQETMKSFFNLNQDEKDALIHKSTQPGFIRG